MSSKTRLRFGLVAAAGSLYCGAALGAPLTNMVVQNGGGKRFLGPDQGIAIHYVVDADALPAGFSQPQVLTALSNAFEAWSDTTYIRFESDGVESFFRPVEQAAKLASDGRIWIQLHNLHTNITDPTQLGTGNNRAAISVGLKEAGWTGGGSVAGNDFFGVIAAWVALNHTNVELASLSTLEEVLCHNIGLALGLDTNTNDPASIMYHETHADGRGAQLGPLDVNVIQQAYPSNNPVPYAFNRSLEVVTTPTNQPALDVPGINEVELRGYDAQGTALSVEITNIPIVLGSFTNQGTLVTYTPNDFHDLINVLGELCYYRFSDGTHESPFYEVKVHSLRQDSFPVGAGDGVPDYFMTDHFGNPDPAAGINRNADDDNDNDLLTNREEYIAGMDPTDPALAQRITSTAGGVIQWQTTPDGLYELQCSEDLKSWVLVGPVLATGSSASLPVGPATGPRAYYRAVKIR